MPLVCPLVIHHSHTGWRGPRRLSELLDADASLLTEAADFIPDQRFALLDLTAHDDEALHKIVVSDLGSLVASALKHAPFDPDSTSTKYSRSPLPQGARVRWTTRPGPRHQPQNGWCRYAGCGGANGLFHTNSAGVVCESESWPRCSRGVIAALADIEQALQEHSEGDSDIIEVDVPPGTPLLEMTVTTHTGQVITIAVPARVSFDASPGGGSTITVVPTCVGCSVPQEVHSLLVEAAFMERDHDPCAE